MNTTHNRFLILLPAFLFFFTITGWTNDLAAGQLQLTWTDNSTNEDGFKIERKAGANGTYAQISSMGPNITSYSDSNLVDGATYCYRVFAFNTSGNSPYTPEACGTAKSTVQSFALTVTKIGAGTVTSSPVGINCGTDCTEPYTSNTAVALTATPAAGYAFAGWSGTGCASSVTMSTNRNCTATFNIQATTTYTLTVGKLGNGIVTSSPAGISCGTDCTEPYTSNTAVSLTATPAAGYTFAGWSGTGCASSVTMSTNRDCTATFSVQTTTYSLAVTNVGNGTVTSSPAGISCPADCSEVYASNTAVSLTATPAAGYTFAGWTGTGCASSVTMSTNRNCTATFNMQINQMTTRIGVFRPSTGEWFLDSDGNGILDCAADICRKGYGQVDMLPVVGDWYGSGKTNIGTFRPGTGSWHLDNGDGSWNTCGTSGDICIGSFGQQGDLPIVKEMSSSNEIIIGVFRPRTTARWKFDTDGDGVLDSCRIDECYSFGTDGDLPVVGDWNGTGIEKIGVFRPGTGQWLLDLNGNGKWDGRATDKLFGTFGDIGDYPVVGDWDGTGKVRIGIFRPSTGAWFLDGNGNGKLDPCGVDVCIRPFGQLGDLPVVGKW